MRTAQKKLKFSHGQIDERLLERQDLAVLDSSASEITNMISTPYGSSKTRQGTINIEDFQPDIDISAITNDVGDSSPSFVEADMKAGAFFQTDTLGAVSDDTEVFQIDLGASKKVYQFDFFCYFDEYNSPFDNRSLTVTVDEDGVVTQVFGGNFANLKPSTIALSGDGTGCEITLETVENDGDIDGSPLPIADGGTGYTTSNNDLSPTVDNLVSSTATVQTSTDAMTWADAGTIEVTNSLLGGNALKSVVIDDTVRYIRLITDAVTGRYYIGGFKLRPASFDFVRLERFEFNEDEQYLIIFSDSLITIYDGTTFKSVLSGITEAQIRDICVTQKDDVMIITHPDFAPKQLVRAAVDANADTWTTPAGWAYTTNALAGTAVTADADHTLINSLIGGYYTITYTVEGYTGGSVQPILKYDILSDTSLASVTANGTYTVNVNAPTIPWNILTFRGAGFTGTITDVEVSGGAITECPTAGGTNTVFNWTLSSLSLENIPKHDFDGETSTAKTTTLTPDVTDGLVTITESGAGAGTFTTASVGQYIDGGGGRIKITDYISTTKVRGVTIIPFYTIDPFSTWDYITGYEDVWSSTRGYPNCCLFYQERLWFGGSKSRAGTIWASRVSDFNNFKNVGNYSNDAIDVTISANQPVEILALYPNRGVQVFTSGSEWIIPEGNLTPDSIDIVKNTANGIKRGVRPIDISGTTLFAEKNGKSLLSFVYNEGQNAYVTSQISLLTSLINDPIDMDVAYNSAQNEANYAFIVNSNGELIVACILLDQKINSYVKFETDGLYKDVCVVGDTVYTLVLRDTGLYLEKFADDVPVDCRRNVRSTLSIEGGLVALTAPYDWFNETVCFYKADGLLGYGVGGGTFSYTGELSGIYCGLAYDYTLNSNKIAVGSQTGSIHSRITEATVEANNTDKLIFCGETLEQTDDDTYQFRGCTSPSRDTRFNITGTFDKIEILSVFLKINYGGR